jgi:hypothetical protein
VLQQSVKFVRQFHAVRVVEVRMNAGRMTRLTFRTSVRERSARVVSCSVDMNRQHQSQHKENEGEREQLGHFECELSNEFADFAK